MSETRRPIVAGNWKMNGDSDLVKQMQSAFKETSLPDVDVIVCPPFPYLSCAVSDDYATGAQDISAHESGAHTGEVAGKMIKAMGCEYVIVGHSERRTDHHESNALVAEKVSQALANKMTPIFCVGESEAIREDGKLFTYLSAQLEAVLDEVGVGAFNQIVVAYEPVWAIGTGKTASPEQAQEVHAFIRDHIAKRDEDIASKLRILYGGSVKAQNAQELFTQPDIDGGLIGGASLNPQDFLSICQSANDLQQR